MNIRKRIAKYLAGITFIYKAVNEQADLSAFREKPARHIIVRNITGLFLILLSYIIGWPVIIFLGILSISKEEPLIVIIGAPAAYAISHFVFFIGMYLTGAYYTKVFMRWSVRIAIEKIFNKNYFFSIMKEIKNNTINTDEKIMIQTEKVISETADGWLPPLSELQKLFNNAKRNELYSKKFMDFPLDSWEDFFKLPLTYKEEMRLLGPEGTLSVPREEAWHYHESFGTTGTPISSWFTFGDYEREAKQTWRWTELIKPGMLVLNRFPYSFAVPPFVLEAKCISGEAVIVPAGYLSWNVTYPRILEIIKRLKVEAIGCLPNELIMLEMAAEKCGYDIKKDLGSLKHVLMSGSVVTQALKEYIEKRWDASVRSVYGSTETGGIASSCGEGNLHIHENAFIIEILDPETGQPVKNGDTGILVVTSFYREASTLFRYVTRDICRMIPGTCQCGDPAPVIQVLGRIDDVINLNGKKILPYDLEQSILEFAGQFDSAVYFVIVTKNRLHIRVETHNGKKTPDEKSMRDIRENLGVPLKMHICPKGDLLDAAFLLRTPEVYKPVTISDWRSEKIKCINLTEALIKWPVVGFQEFMDIVFKFIKNAVNRRTLK